MTSVSGFKWVGPTAEDFNRGSPTVGEFISEQYGELIVEESENELPPSDAELDELIDSQEYEMILIKVLTWKEKTTDVYFERFHDADLADVNEAAEYLAEYKYINIYNLTDRIVL